MNTKFLFQNLAIVGLFTFCGSHAVQAQCSSACDMSGNTSFGDFALESLDGGEFNTAVGASALFRTTRGLDNTAVGFETLLYNTTGFGNTGLGSEALVGNDVGQYNTALGDGALALNSSGNFNTAVGHAAMNGDFDQTGDYNTAVGSGALLSNNRGSYNTAIGPSALDHVSDGSRNIALGQFAGTNVTTGGDNIEIGNQGRDSDNQVIRVGTPRSQKNTYIAGISGATVASGVGVIVDSNGHLGTVTSSRRFKTAIQPMGDSSQAILGLKPVSFRYKQELDPNGVPQFGLVAEDVAKVDADLVARDDQGKPYTVRYEAVNAMLLNEFIKMHARVEEQNTEINDLKAAVSRLESLQRVASDSGELKPAR